MPAKPKVQRKATAIAEHEPEKLFKRNRGLLKIDKADLHKLASTKEKGLPTRVTRDEVRKRLKKK